MKYPLEKYKYFTFKNEKGGTTIVAVSTYAGKTVKGYAKCDPADTFDLEKGKMLAAARCNAKIAEKRAMRSADKYMEALKEVENATAKFDKMRQYFFDAQDQYEVATTELNDILKNY